jgi:hypothetical protein
MTVAAAFVLATSLSGTPAIGRERPYQASLVASIGHSEWCRTGRVRLNLATGHYTITAPPTWRTCRRPPWPSRVRTAVLPSADLATIRDAWRRAESEGLERPVCRNGGRPETMYVSNGGARTLRLTLHRRTLAPPRDEDCWSDAASHLHDVMERMFNPRRD